MPGILPQYDPTDQSVAAAAAAERRERQAMITRAWAYYDGNHDKPLKISPGERDDNIILNICGRAIDKAIEMLGIPSRLELPGGVRDVAGSYDDAVAPEQATLDQVFEAYESSLGGIILSGMIAGHVFLKLYYDDSGLPAFDLLDPQLVTVFWDATQPKRVLFYRIEWQQGEAARRQDIVRGGLIDRVAPWVVLEYERVRDGDWRPLQQLDWPYSFAPIVDGRNRSRPHAYYGVSHLVSGGLNDAINFVASNIGRILKYYASPRTIGVGVPPGALQETRIDGFFTVPAGAEVFNLEMHSDLRSSLEFLTMLRAELFSSLRVLDTASVRDKLGQLTNFGVRMLFSDMLEMIEEKRALYGSLFADAFRRLLIMRGLPETLPMPNVIWPEPLPEDRLERVKQAQIEAALGVVSKQTLAADLGRDFPTEQARIIEEQSLASDILASTLANVSIRGGF